MQLPNKDKAAVSERKIRDYLLSESHAIGKTKAKFFRLHGFTEENTELFRAGLIAIAQTEQVASAEKTTFGTKYVIDGGLASPIGVIIRLRTVWIIETESESPTLVTVYPLD
jgi:hypothetical protein